MMTRVKPLLVVSMVAEGDVVGPGDDEPVAAHGVWLGVTRDVSLQER